MMRRDILRGAGAIGLGLFGQPAAARELPLRQAAEAAYLYALPLVESAASRSASFATEQARPNVVFHDRKLATPAFRSVTTPNNDTLYSRCWIDLRQGPVTIELPRTGDRYFSAAFLDMYSNNFAILGTRTTGGEGGRYVLVGPDAASPDAAAIRSPTRWVWMLVRTLVSGPADVPEVRRLQDRIVVSGPAADLPPTYADHGGRWDLYFEGAQALLTENRPPVTDEFLLEQIAPLGLRPGGGFDAGRFSADQVREIEAGVADARRRLAQRGRQGGPSNNWSYSKPNIGDYGQDYLYRAQVALGGLGALPRIEATYMRALGDGGRLYFEPDTNHRLHFAADGLPPVDGFWSITMYEKTEAGQFFLADNPLNRYSIGNRTEGLKFNPDGSLDIWLGSRPQEAGNWLPAPAGKPWSVVFRAYLPRDRIVTDAYALPPLTPV